jgi:peptide/nickel transport system permease protein|tara:strand:- start:491 stop:1474 length:984 start_codon:yes stop_codon:yes gene_type:complete
MQFLTVVLRRFLYAFLLLLAVVVFNFILLSLVPGDIAETIAGESGGASAELMAEIRRSYGLDQPFHVQLFTYVGKVLQGDLGDSYYFNIPVLDLILDRLGPTLLLVVTALLLAIFTGTLFGVIAAQRPNGVFSHFITILALIGFSAPVFWTAFLLIILFVAMLQIMPLSGLADPLSESGTWRWYLDVAHHLFLPVISLSSIYLAQYSRLARASMMDILGSDYIRTARAKGLGQRMIIYKHGLRNAVIPVITIAGLQFSHIFSGAVVIETVFSWPGLGTLAFESILRGDTPTIMGILFFSAFVVIVFNLLTDLAYRIIDPRIRLSNTA